MEDWILGLSDFLRGTLEKRTECKPIIIVVVVIIILFIF